MDRWQHLGSVSQSILMSAAFHACSNPERVGVDTDYGKIPLSCMAYTKDEMLNPSDEITNAWMEYYGFIEI